MGEETVDGLEAKYVSGLSTIMVATIQEAKDRIAQIEYIFCSQLFPNFQSKSKAWKERENSLLSQIQELKSENLALIKDKEHLSKLNNKELHTGLVALLRVKGSNELNKDEIEMILSQVKGLKVKAEELSTKTLVTENLLKKLERLSTESGETQRKLNSLEEEKQRLTTRLQLFEENAARLQTMVRQKDGELKEGKMALEAMGEEHKTYLAELEALREDKSSELALEMNKRKKLFTAYKNLKSQYNFLCKKFGLTTDSVPHQSDREDDTYQSGQDERPAISNSFKRKHSEATDGADKAPGSSINSEKERILKTLQTPNTSISHVAARTGTGLNGSCEKESILKTAKTPTISVSAIVRSPGIRSGPSDAKTPQLSGSKRPASVWRETRSRQSPGGQDPHDDFLDTPVEKIKKAAVEEKHVHDAAKKDNSDDETQDMNPKPSPSKQRIQVAERSKQGFKHVEPVRKKAERDNLKGIECKQCKKFYDAVLPENEGNGKGLRCEHHEGVSRHRYKYAPPMTPEGFWNIGFESEM